MAGRARNCNIETTSARKKLKRGRQPHWQTLEPGKSHLGWQRDPDAPEGRWLARRFDGRKYTVRTIGVADDARKADGDAVLDYAMATRAALAVVDAPSAKKPPASYRVRDAIEDYLIYKRNRGQSEAAQRATLLTARRHILPSLGHLIVNDLQPETLDAWAAAIAAQPPMDRTGKPREKRAAPEAIKRGKASANRIGTILKAALRLALQHRKVTNSQWLIGAKKYRDVETPRTDYWTVGEAARLVAACDPDFAQIVQAGLLCGARWGELRQLRVQDFKRDHGALYVAAGTSKTGKERFITLSRQGEAFFQSVCAGRGRDEPLLRTANGAAWKLGQQRLRMRAACKAAALRPIGFHCTRHTCASLSLMGGVEPHLLAANLGMSLAILLSTYGHISDRHRKERIEAGSPKFDFPLDRKVVALR
ncbi:MAG: tyrosine-type recombinase/integrase [Beijerinckiaceae bacterium]|nr:tyrosine-type recombinase/integrase [Beijerinckiaceae bacterium]